MKFTVLEAPICAGSPTLGSEHAYRTLREQGLESRLGSDTEFCDMAPSGRRGLPYPKELKCLEEVVDISRTLYGHARTAMLRGRLPISVGGDHSIAIGSIAAAASVVGAENLSVIYIDGHTDINTEASSESGFIHGMPLACAMGLCSDRLTVGAKVNLYGPNTFILGARSIDRGEYPIIREQGVHLYTAEELLAHGAEQVMDEVIGKIATPYIHVSFDVDVMDEHEFPSTGYRMPNGLSLEETRRLLVRAAETGKVCSLDCVEYNPELDPTRSDCGKLLSLLGSLGDALREQQETEKVSAAL